ncbi:P-loop NTPase fold protein [Streptomyces sp. AK02-01A]|uniref:KAP family P-loop NTPase fold protein n=1 Tax=Streptomyces sp. AK02-01A TaxID=3028648 RepID=UPI0029BA50B0|nr:P-loop NTPase fold protein [Streptomyces sp. AK02-01A]MDX3854229.1 P-loop NTPase fold protein [Streptomyces sp. AK02-01A]
MTAEMRLWDDNPTQVDLLGFAAIVDTVVASLEVPGLDPVTVGVHAPWGAGKSTVLQLLHERLFPRDDYLLVRLDPWEFDDQFDVRGSVVAEILQTVLSKYSSTDSAVDGLLKRISHSRVAITLARGTLVTQSEGLIEALTPTSKKDPKGMAGFREAFQEMLDDLPSLTRVVVLVDDLDRCLPDAVMATLEAIKLFLSVKKVAFVLAADQHMVRESIAVSLDATGRDEQFALRYLEKIVQVPLSLPRMSAAEAETFIALLLCAQVCPDAANYAALVRHAQERRSQGQSPVLADLQKVPWQPGGDTLNLANRLATGLSAHSAGSPRSIKRFLNEFSLRRHIAEGQGIHLDPSVIAKLMLLEDSLSKDFQILVELPDGRRPELLARWQEWGRGERDEKPDGVSDGSRAWAAAEPDLTGAPIGQYLSLAASLGSLTAGASLSQEQLNWVVALVGESEPHRTAAQEAVVQRPVSEQRALVTALLDRARRVQNPEWSVESIVCVAKKTEELRQEIAEGVWHLRSVLNPSCAYEVGSSEVEELRAVAQRLAQAGDVDAMVRAAAETVTS